MDDNTERDGSDSDWDSTLDFTSARGHAVPIGQMRPKISDEIEEESALSGESDLDIEENLPLDQQVIKNELKPTNEKSRDVSPNQKENNILLAQRQRQQQLMQQQQQLSSDRPANQSSNSIQRTTPEPPPYNFRDALTDNRTSPVPSERSKHEKGKRSRDYDLAPSPTPRGVNKKQGSIRSVGSWDDSDPDERTLREIRTNYQTQKQKEELKNREEDSVIEDAPQTARSEGTWKSWTGKFGKKKKGSKNNDHSQASVIETNVRKKESPPQQLQQLQQHHHQQLQQQQQQQQQLSARSIIRSTREEVMSPSMIEVKHESYTPRVIQHHTQNIPDPRSTIPQYNTDIQTIPNIVVDKIDDNMLQYDGKLMVKDEQTGRLLYYFGHGNLGYYEVKENDEEATLPPIADKVDQVVQRVWQEVFALFRILFSIIIWFIVELFYFITKHIFRPLLTAVLVSIGDFIVKPLLSAIFNGFIQPGSVFWWNVFTGMRHMFTPIGEIIHRIFQQFAMLFQSIRLFNITWVSGQPQSVQTV